jgi:hypothetical protein
MFIENFLLTVFIYKFRNEVKEDFFFLSFFQKLKRKELRLSDRLFSDKSASNTSINSVGSIDSLNFDDSLAETSLKKSLSNSEINSLSEQEFLDSGLHETQSLSEVDNLTIRISPEKVINLPSLTDAQVRAITGWILKRIFIFIVYID